MNTLRRVLTVAALATMATGLASAAQIVSYTSTFGPTITDIVNTPVAITPFVSGALGVPLGATLESFTITYTETINGSIAIQNTGASSSTITGHVDSQGYVYLFNPATNSSTEFAADLFNNQIDPTNTPTDDAFGGNGPDPQENFVATLASGTGAGPTNYTKTQGPSSFGPDSNAADLAKVQAAWNAYIVTFTKNNVGVTNGGSGANQYTNFVSGSVTVAYTYDVFGAPEPTTMALMGGALLGLGLLRKRFAK